MKITKGGYESASSFGDSSRRNSGANSISERTATTAFSAVSNRSPPLSNGPPPNEWVQYTDSLEDSLVEAKEYAAALLTKSDGNQSAILQELKEQRKQTQLAMEQNKKLMELLAKNMMNTNVNGGEDDKVKTSGRPVRKKRKCGNCDKMGFHEDDDCFGLEKNKDNHPAWYK